MPANLSLSWIVPRKPDVPSSRTLKVVTRSFPATSKRSLEETNKRPEVFGQTLTNGGLDSSSGSLCNNDLPEFQNNGGGDEGILTRLLMYHFAKRFSENPRSQNELPLDRSLPGKLASLEWKQQYMLWLLDLYRDYRLAEGFLPALPQEVIEVTDAYKREVDTLQLFVEKYLRLDKDKKDPQFYLFKTPLYDHYVSACEKEKCTALKNQSFSKQIRGMLDDNFKYRKGTSKGGGSNRDQHYVGIELVPIPPDTPKDKPQSPFVPDDREECDENNP